MVEQVSPTGRAEAPFGPVRRSICSGFLCAAERDIGAAVYGEHGPACPASAHTAVADIDFVLVVGGNFNCAAQAKTFHKSVFR